MTYVCKKIRLGYQSYILEKIKQLEQDIALYENRLDDLSSSRKDALSDFYRIERSNEERGKIEKTREELDKLRIELSQVLPTSQSEPIFFIERERTDSDFLGGQFYPTLGVYVYQNAAYQISETNSDEENKLLILEFVDRERRKFEQLKNKFSGAKSEELKYERLRIPESVRIAVWRRDQGRCAKCGNRENLEYDHIVPVSKGGGNTERNIELLCQNCNRSKSNRIE
jgi:hypothetical protein